MNFLITNHTKTYNSAQYNSHNSNTYGAPVNIAERLRNKMRELGLNESQLSRRSSVPQPTINRILSGESSSPRKPTVESLARPLGVSPDWLLFGSGSEAPNTGSPSAKDYALIPQFKAKGSCGYGYLNEHVETTEGLAFKRDWLHRMKAKPENLFVIYADGDSMEPYIFAGDVVLFDTSSTEPRDKQVYVIRRPDGGNSIKRLTQQLSGTWVIRSDNPDKIANPDEPVTEEAIHEMPILGRVIWRGGGVGG
ncbi:XRE family transcriptional regulator [Pseudomonas extremaustralis]|jgi:phage repressor protein C with HTH and peptisase S24 domain